MKTLALIFCWYSHPHCSRAVPSGFITTASLSIIRLSRSAKDQDFGAGAADIDICVKNRDIARSGQCISQLFKGIFQIGGGLPLPESAFRVFPDVVVCITDQLPVFLGVLEQQFPSFHVIISYVCYFGLIKSRYGTRIPGTFEEWGNIPEERQGRRTDLDRRFVLVPSLLLKFPINSSGTPDFTSMEAYIKSLPYSERI